MKDKKNGVSVNTCIGRELFEMLETFCAVTGQSKTVAVERAIEAYCAKNRSAGAKAVDGRAEDNDG